jgi:hypothetical protein
LDFNISGQNLENNFSFKELKNKDVIVAVAGFDVLDYKRKIESGNKSDNNNNNNNNSSSNSKKKKK